MFNCYAEVLAHLFGRDGEDIASHSFVASHIKGVARLSVK